MAKTEVKHITLGLVLGYIFGILFILTGAVALMKSFIGGLLIIIGALLIFPPFVRFIESKFNIKLSGWLRVIAFLVLIVIGSSLAYPQGAQTSGLFEKIKSSPSPSTTTETQPEVIPQQEASWHNIKNITGSGYTKTEPFTIKGNMWKAIIVYSTDSPDYASFSAYTYRPGSDISSEQTTLNGGTYSTVATTYMNSKEAFFYKGNGVYYFDIMEANTQLWFIYIYDYY